MVKVLIAGDFASRFRVAAQIEQGNYSSLDEVKPFVQSVDYSIVNFESPVVLREAKPIDKTGPNLMCSEKAMECVAQAGFSCVTLANNHFRDYGQIGVEDTIDSCTKYGLDYVGGGKSQIESTRVLYKQINRKTLAIINVCENEWSIASENHGGSNPLDIVSVCRSLNVAKQQSDFALIIVHGGTEHYNLPTPRMKNTYRFFVENGADAIINHHQHCYSGYEIYQGKPIFYGLGNFCFDKNSVGTDELWERGYMVELEFSDQIGFRLLPYVQCDKTQPVVQMIKEQEEFNSSIERLNSIIADDFQLKNRFEHVAIKGAIIAKNLLVPYSSPLAKSMSSRGLLPSFVTDDKLKQLLAHIQCEAHRDVLLFGLKHRSIINEKVHEK